MINLVIFNGGRGACTLIPSILENKNIKLSSVVNAYDDGKSTGAIRNYFNMLGPSDIRKVQQLMLPADDPDFENNFWLFDFRFPKKGSNSSFLEELTNEVNSKSSTLFKKKFQNKILVKHIKTYLDLFLKNLSLIQKSSNLPQFSFKDCSLMNCIYAGAYILHGRNIQDAALHIEKLFNLKGSVLPNSLENKKLMGIRENGEFLYNEAEIVELRSNISVERVFLLDDYLNKKYFCNLSKKEKLRYLLSHQSYVAATSRVIRAINDADIIVYSPGTQHSSLYPTYLSKGVPEAIANNTKSKKIFISNIGADYETPKYDAHDYILGAYKYLNLSDPRLYEIKDFFTDMLVNLPATKKKKNYVQVNTKKLKSIPVKMHISDYESSDQSGKHSGHKLFDLIQKIYNFN